MLKPEAYTLKFLPAPGDPITGWSPTYICRVCGEPYPVLVQKAPRAVCSQCGSKSYRKARKS